MTQISSSVDDMVSVVAEVDEQDVDTNVRRWRAAGRSYARQAQELYLEGPINEGDGDVDADELVARRVDVATLAGLAAMYFALAADGDRFGPLPPEATNDD